MYLNAIILHYIKYAFLLLTKVKL